MSNIRFVADNITLRSTVAATNVASGYSADRLKSHLKSSWMRTTGNNTSISVTTAANEIINTVALPLCNLTATAYIRVRYYSDVGGTALLYDNSFVPVPALTKEFRNAAVISKNGEGFPYGSGRYATMYTTRFTNVRKILLDVSDASLSFLDLAYLVAGEYMTPQRSVQWDYSCKWSSSSELFRNEAGDSCAKIQPRWKIFTFNLVSLVPSERIALFSMLRDVSCDVPVFISGFPESADIETEELYTIVGRLPAESELTTAAANKFLLSLSIPSL